MSSARFNSLVFVLPALLLFAAGCVKHNRPYVTETGAARMAEAQSLSAKWLEAKRICNDAGLATGTRRHAQCAREYRLHEVKAMRKRAKALGDAVADRHGLCINPRTFDIDKCQEI